MVFLWRLLLSSISNCTVCQSSYAHADILIRTAFHHLLSVTLLSLCLWFSIAQWCFSWGSHSAWFKNNTSFWSDLAAQSQLSSTSSLEKLLQHWHQDHWHECRFMMCCQHHIVCIHDQAIKRWYNWENCFQLKSAWPLKVVSLITMTTILLQCLIVILHETLLLRSRQLILLTCKRWRQNRQSLLTTIDELFSHIITYLLLAPTAYVNLLCTNSVVYVPGFQIVIEVIIERLRCAGSLNLQHKLNMLEGLFVSVDQTIYQHRLQTNLYTLVQAN